MAVIDDTNPPSRVLCFNTPTGEAAWQPFKNKIAVMLRVAPTCSTPILVDPEVTTYWTLLKQIQLELYARAPHFATGFEFEGLYIEWDQNMRGFPDSSKLDQHNFVATMALLRVRQGKLDVLCIKSRVTKAGVPMKLVD